MIPVPKNSNHASGRPPAGTAAAIVVRAVDYVVNTLGLVVDRYASGIVIPEAHARHDVDAVRLVAADRNWRHVRDRLRVKSALRRTLKGSWRRLVKMVAFAGLVVDEVHDAGCFGAERVLRDRIGVSARLEADVQRFAIRMPLDLVKRAFVGRVQRARGAVGGYAGRARRAIDRSEEHTSEL